MYFSGGINGVSGKTAVSPPERIMWLHPDSWSSYYWFKTHYHSTDEWTTHYQSLNYQPEKFNYQPEKFWRGTTTRFGRIF